MATTNALSPRHMTALKLIDRAQKDLARMLTDGERRDLLMDNTPWTTEKIRQIVQDLRGD